MVQILATCLSWYGVSREGDDDGSSARNGRLKNALQFPSHGRCKEDLPHGFAQRARSKLELFLQRIQEYEALYDESTVFLVRTQGVGYAKAEEMVNHGVSGPNLVAGVNYDVRWAHPYSVYELDWEPPMRDPRLEGRLLRQIQSQSRR